MRAMEIIDSRSVTPVTARQSLLVSARSGLERQGTSSHAQTTYFLW
jgi:hypothetical protein